jgi:uncharacterized protein (DUF302 family)
MLKHGDDTMLDYGFIKEVQMDYELVVKAVTKALEEAGFGVLTTIDVKEKFKQKLGIDFQKYVILGACDPASARKAIEAEENIGLMLPCNVIVYEKNSNVVIAAIKPTVAMQMIDNPPLGTIAADVEARLKAVIDSLN